MKEIVWLADSRSNIRSFPSGVQDDIGYALVYRAAGRTECQIQAAAWSRQPGAFQKKSKSGIATPKSEMALIRQRLRQLRDEVKDGETRGS